MDRNTENQQCCHTAAKQRRLQLDHSVDRRCTTGPILRQQLVRCAFRKRTVEDMMRTVRSLMSCGSSVRPSFPFLQSMRTQSEAHDEARALVSSL